MKYHRTYSCEQDVAETSVQNISWPRAKVEDFRKMLKVTQITGRYCTHEGIPYLPIYIKTVNGCSVV